ncbi:MAG: hypothetical protein AAF349_17920 [Cyanobacteria bacterium P01_A01_bin.68]
MDNIVDATVHAAVGAIVLSLIERIPSWYEAFKSSFPAKEEFSGKWVSGESVRIEDLRLLRSLLGESEGRYLTDERESNFYGPVLTGLVEKGLIAVDSDKYFLTQKGHKYTLSYLRWLRNFWKPNTK